MTEEARARQLWRLLEPIHAVVYFAADARDRFDEIGLKGFWMGYFASRSAALGAASPEVVEATFYVFHPEMVRRAIPEAWQRATPEDVLAARRELADASLRTALGELADGDEVAEVAALAVAIAQQAPLAGRPLGAAHAALPLPEADDPLGRLWWATSVLREHRGDGHVAALVAGDVDPCAALRLAGATGNVGDDPTLLQRSRRWPDDDWAAATERLAVRGWLDDDGQLTAEGRAGHGAVEAATDRAAWSAYASVPDADLDSFAATLRPLAERVVGSGTLHFPNPIGLTRP